MNDADKASQEKASSPDNKNAPQPHGRIQKISQEGSKSMYMIILRKDCLADYQSKPSPKDAETVQKQKKSDWGLESPDETAKIDRRKLCELSDDVRLNLSNINDEEYDSNQSASSVFLKQDSGVFDQDTVFIDSDNCSQSDGHVKEKSLVNSYVIRSPFAFKHGQKSSEEQCSASATPSHQSQSSTSAARKIVLVTPSSEPKSLLKRTVTFSSEAVPVISKSYESPFQAPTPLLPANPKAVPTFTNISPISQLCLGSKKSSFVPICPAETPAVSAPRPGPLTSTPVYNESRSKSHRSRSASVPHRPVYIIPSPFTRQNSSNTNPSASTPGNSSGDKSLIAAGDILRTPNLNNSSGFVSGSSGLETPESSRLSGGGTVISDGRLLDGSGGVVISVGDDTDGDTGLDTESLTSSQESTETVEKGRLATLLSS